MLRSSYLVPVIRSSRTFQVLSPFCKGQTEARGSEATSHRSGRGHSWVYSPGLSQPLQPCPGSALSARPGKPRFDSYSRCGGLQSPSCDAAGDRCTTCSSEVGWQGQVRNGELLWVATVRGGSRSLRTTTAVQDDTRGSSCESGLGKRKQGTIHSSLCSRWHVQSRAG